jgi:hypothetical protein
VQDSTPATGYGSGPELSDDASPVKRMFLRFTVSGLPGPVRSAVLRLHTRNSGSAASPYGGRVTAVSSVTWPESITWETQPAIDGAVVGQVGAVTGNTWYQVDVTPLVTGDGAVSLAVTSTSSDGAYYDAREGGALGPQLVVTTGPAPSPSPTGPEGDPVLVGAGDISTCSSDNDEATAKLLDGIAGTVFTAGDNAYPSGAPNDFASCYGPTWGRHLARTRPAVGNHDYGTAGAGGYFGYFGAAAGDPAKGYYSYDLGAWHVVALNSNCSIVSCAAGSDQEQWLRADLAAHPSSCTAAYWHHPRFTSGTNHAPELAVAPLYQALYDLGADVVVTGHNHQYERFAPLDPGGTLDPLRGIAEFVVGTGGAELYGFGTPQVGSEARSADGYGVLTLTLHPTGYDWQFVPVPGNPFTDAGSASCH